MSQPTNPSNCAKRTKRAPSMRVRKSKKSNNAGPVLPPEVQRTRADETNSEVLEFASAIDAYKRNSRKPFPTWGEVLEVLMGLGYRRSA